MMLVVVALMVTWRCQRPVMMWMMWMMIMMGRSLMVVMTCLSGPLVLPRRVLMLPVWMMMG